MICHVSNIKDKVNAVKETVSVIKGIVKTKKDKVSVRKGIVKTKKDNVSVMKGTVSVLKVKCSEAKDKVSAGLLNSTSCFYSNTKKTPLSQGALFCNRVIAASGNFFPETEFPGIAEFGIGFSFDNVPVFTVKFGFLFFTIDKKAAVFDGKFITCFICKYFVFA